MSVGIGDVGTHWWDADAPKHAPGLLTPAGGPVQVALLSVPATCPPAAGRRGCGCSQLRRAGDLHSPGQVLGPGQAPTLPLPPREAQDKGRRDPLARSGLGEDLGKEGGPSAPTRAWLMALEHQGPAPASGESWDGFLTDTTKGPEASQGTLKELKGPAPHAQSLARPARGSPAPPDPTTLRWGQQRGVQKL